MESDNEPVYEKFSIDDCLLDTQERFEEKWLAELIAQRDRDRFFCFCADNIIHFYRGNYYCVRQFGFLSILNDELNHKGFSVKYSWPGLMQGLRLFSFYF